MPAALPVPPYHGHGLIDVTEQGLDLQRLYIVHEKWKQEQMQPAPYEAQNISLTWLARNLPCVTRVKYHKHIAFWCQTWQQHPIVLQLCQLTLMNDSVPYISN